MNNQTLVIYDFNIFYEMLKEIEIYLNFGLINVEKKNFLKLKNEMHDNYLVISKKKINNIQNQIIIENFPIQITKLVEIINVNFIKKKFMQQSQFKIGNYKLDINARKIHNTENILSLTEREINIIIFLKNSKKPVKINQLQSQVWGYNSKLETHTVETHIYRLRKKINKNFGDKNFIKSTKQGYVI